MAEKEYLSVSDLTDILKLTLEHMFDRIYLRGEISGYRPSSSGHCYFTLKDTDATISALIFRNKLPQIQSAFHDAGLETIENGQEVLLEGSLSLYKKGGSYSVIVDKMMPAGIGSLYQKFELLKKKLETEGLFDSARKKAIPQHPEHIGVVTSPTGAALQDILNILRRRSPQTKVTVFPAAVQGNDAKFQIAKAVRFADFQYRTNGPYHTDVLLIARGGGSMEELWAFNEPEVAYSIADCEIPVVSGVGHEIDFTIADFCADLRAPTPSAAAELVSRNSMELLDQVIAFQQRLENALRHELLLAKGRSQPCSPEILYQRMRRICNDCQQISYLEERVEMLFRNIVETKRNKVQLFMEKLNSMNPKQILERGYAVIYNAQGNVIDNAAGVQTGESLRIQVKTGEIHAIVN